MQTKRGSRAVVSNAKLVFLVRLCANEALTSQMRIWNQSWQSLTYTLSSYLHTPAVAVSYVQCLPAMSHFRGAAEEQRLSRWRHLWNGLACTNPCVLTLTHGHCG